ncbi:hypothetical protein U9M48_026806 [Paspalum notatum var. saurae]|uniref:Uncharacterized protein n=1 Tax=Paspalum notatum var. saurae TaxID=547442 RepID=A0AAQ3WYQ1_PASNO
MRLLLPPASPAADAAIIVSATGAIPPPPPGGYRRISTLAAASPPVGRHPSRVSAPPHPPTTIPVLPWSSPAPPRANRHLAPLGRWRSRRRP